MEMRRKDLAVTQPEAMDQIICACDCIRIALTDGDYPYIIPMNFGYQRVDGQAVFYLHSAEEGHKVSLFRKEQRCGFELDTHRQLKIGATACAFSMAYESIAGTRPKRPRRCELLCLHIPIKATGTSRKKR